MPPPPPTLDPGNAMTPTEPTHFLRATHRAITLACYKDKRLRCHLFASLGILGMYQIVAVFLYLSVQGRFHMQEPMWVWNIGASRSISGLGPSVSQTKCSDSWCRIAFLAKLVQRLGNTIQDPMSPQMSYYHFVRARYRDTEEQLRRIRIAEILPLLLSSEDPDVRHRASHLSQARLSPPASNERQSQE